VVLTPKLCNHKCLWKNTQMGQAWNCTSIEYTPSTLSPGFPPAEKFSTIYAMSHLKHRTIRNTYFFLEILNSLIHSIIPNQNKILQDFFQKDNSRIWQKNTASEASYGSPKVPPLNFRHSFQLPVYCEACSFVYYFCFYINNCVSTNTLPDITKQDSIHTEPVYLIFTAINDSCYLVSTTTFSN